MQRTILIYGAILAVGSLGLEWLQYLYFVRTYPAEAWLALFAMTFMALGIWVGARLVRRASPAAFEMNKQVQETLGISERELQVLELLAAGQAPHGSDPAGSRAGDDPLTISFYREFLDDWAGITLSYDCRRPALRA
jgi:hypothetical protein